MYNFVSMPISNNNPNRAVKSLKAFVFHYTANYSRGANARANRNYFANHPEAEASANYCIDDHEVVECIKPGMVAWHAGGSYYTAYAKKNFALNGATRPNDFTVGFEMCVNSDGDWNTTVENTIEFAARLAIELGVPGIDLIRHYDVTTKSCPAMYVNDTAAWENFKARIKARIAQLQGKPSSPAPNVSNPTTPVKDGDYGIVTASVLNVRKGAGTGYSVIGQLQNGARVRIGTKVGNWYNIYFGDHGGWVCADYVTLESKPAVDTTPQKQPKGTYGTVTADVLNVRKGAGTNYPVIGQLKQGEQVKLAVKIGDWWNIYYGDHGGFVYAQYIEV
jgi:uncharacterized protein YraI